MTRGISSTVAPLDGLQLELADDRVEASGCEGMKDITNPKVIWMKGILFLVLGTSSAALLFIDAPSVRTGVLLGVTIWAFCRAYYFAFYVIERYVDPACRFSGLIAFSRYVLRRKAR